jgi:hypothetical protein
VRQINIPDVPNRTKRKRWLSVAGASHIRNHNLANTLRQQDNIKYDFVERVMSKFNWHADFFGAAEKGPPVKRGKIQADNADDAARIAKSQMGPCTRVEVRRAATAAPVRVVYSREEDRANIRSAEAILSFAKAPPAVPVVL